MPKLVVCSHNLKSDALKNLANYLTEKLGYKVWRKKPNNLRPHQVPVSFLQGIDKIRQFRAYQQNNVPIPSFACTLEDARQLPSKEVVIRSIVDGSEGRGISIVKKEDLHQIAPLYTAYVPKKKEYRVHVFNNTVIDIQEKRKKRIDGEQKEFQVRNTANGYVFCRADVQPPADCAPAALAAVRALGRTYGAVDVIWNEKQNKCFVLEVNSRPGMQGTTVAKYGDAILNTLPENVKNPPPKRIVRRARRVQQQYWR